ncbi:NmrA family NAD(P)-binding protein [Kitasatospora sp. NPDC086791]|uniref:NmrA family NAD(P)-binding protein n=1 Tax=Kitasatospora sp. NPDC086791 TaxID=3155178 RepID=UPI00343A55CF
MCRSRKASSSSLSSAKTAAQGGATARALLRAGRPVRALTRDQASPAAVELAALGADVVRADFDAPASPAAALDGAGALFAMFGCPPSGTDLESEVRQGTALPDAAHPEIAWQPLEAWAAARTWDL